MNSIQSHDKQLHIYITTPNTLKKDGVLSPALVSEKELQHYAGRAGSKKKEAILKYLDSTFPGRSRSISVLTEPIPDTAAPKFLEFRNETQHVILPPIEQLKKLKLIDEVRLSKRPYPVVTQLDYKKIDWSKNPTNLLFKDINHYQLVLTTGKIPSNVIEIDEIKHSQESKGITMSDASHIDLNNETDRKTVLEKIATLIKRIPNRGMLTQPMLAAMMLDNYIERTEEHIKLVRNFGLKLIPFIEEKGISGALFEQELSAHDHDKLDNFDIVPIYAAYTQFVYNNGRYKDLCRLEDGVEKEFNEVAWPLHYKLNSHHVGEHFGKLVDGCYVVESDKHFIEIAHMVADWMAMGREMNNSATVWWSKCKQENKYSFKEEDVAWIEKLLLVENDTKQVPIDTSIEDIHPNVDKQIVNGLIYHGSPVKTTILKANKNKAHGNKHGVFVSPFKGIAACFIPDEKEIIERLKNQGIDTTSINFQYSKWNEDYKTLQDLPNPLEIYLGNPTVKEFKGVAHGYIYTIDYSKYKDKSKMFMLAKDSDVEFILDCDVTPLKCEEVKIPYIVKYSELAQQEGSQEDIDPMDAIMLSNDTSGITDSMERFYVNDKGLEQELLDIPRLDAKTLLATLKPGDLIVTYPKVSTFSDKISYTLNSFVQRMAFSSIKLVGTNNDVIGYGVTGKLMLQSAKIEQLPTLFSGITVLRHKQLNTTIVKKIYSWVYDKLTKDIPYDKFGILKAIVERLFKIPGVQLTSDTIDNSISALYCSTILHLAFKKFGLDTGISIIGDFNIFPKDFLYSKRFNKVGLYLDDGEDTSTEESRINKITKLARAQYDADGPNQWSHINRVLREGYVYCKLLKIEMSDTLYTAIMFHDCAKGDSKKDHGKESSKKAKPLLEPFFTKQELSEILIAIAEHNNNKPGTSQTSELLKAADANILDIAWFLSKLYWKRKNKGMSEDVIYKDCLEAIQKGYLTFDHEGAYRPKYWAMRYEKELPKAQQTIAALTEDAVKQMIKTQLAKTNNGPSYESIVHTGENGITRNDNYDIIKVMLSSVSEYKYGLYYKGAGLVTDQKRFHDFDPKDLLLQSPEMFVKNKGGMCHDATLYVDTLLTKKKFNHKNIYVESGKEPYLPTHSFVVVEADKGKWYVVDVFSIQHCVYKDEFKTWQDAAKFRLVKWLEEEHLEKYPVKALMIQKFPPPNSNIELFMQYMNKYGIVYNANRPISKEDLMISANSTTIKEIVESNKPNLESLPDCVKIKKSKISGNGIFSTIDLKKNVIVGVGFYYTQTNKKLNPDKDIHRTMLGKYVNHSATPNCILKTEIRNKTHMFLFITNEDIKRDTELTINYRLIPWEGEREFTNKSSSNEDLVINQHTSIKEIVESNKPENTISIGLEALDISTEAAAAISTKKKAILDYICKYCDIMDPSKLNSTRYRKMISGMTDKQFDTFMHDMRDGKFQLHIVAPNMKVNLKVKDMIAAADALKLKLFHRIWMRDNATGRKFLSDNEYLVVKLPVRRQEQFIDKKMSVPDNDRSIDGLTGQVSWDSKACAITNPEIQILAARNMDATLFELVNVRGGNINSYAELKRSLEENGEARLNDLDPTARSRVAVMGGVLLTAMLIDSNL